ncbi:MAG: Fic family protein [Patescibacteria group bacterium]
MQPKILNKNTSYVLLHAVGGNNTAGKISKQLPNIDLRSVQRALIRLTEIGLLIRNGINNPRYSVNYENLVRFAVADKFLENENRPMTKFNHELFTWLDTLSNKKLDVLFGEYITNEASSTPFEPMTPKELEYLTVELSWKSSALEGNTYTLLDTQLLLLEGIKAKNKTAFETRMILNHKDAVAFIIEHKELFRSSVDFRSLEELHRIIGNNLGISTGVRKKLVRITASNYKPLANPHQLREQATSALGVISRAANPYVKALLALGLIPYLQIFEDGNKRTGRMLANALLIHSVGKGFSLRKTDAKALALAYLSFYEFNSMYALSRILGNELEPADR